MSTTHQFYFVQNLDLWFVLLDGINSGLIGFSDCLAHFRRLLVFIFFFDTFRHGDRISIGIVKLALRLHICSVLGQLSLNVKILLLVNRSIAEAFLQLVQWVFGVFVAILN